MLVVLVVGVTYGRRRFFFFVLMRYSWWIGMIVTVVLGYSALRAGGLKEHAQASSQFIENRQILCMRVLCWHGW